MAFGVGSPAESDESLDRKAAHRWVWERLAELRPVLREARTILRQRHKQVRRARRAQRQARTEVRLKATSVKDLAKGSRLTTKHLVDGGVLSAADVLEFGEKGLLQIHRVGEKTARGIMGLARAAEQVQAADLRPPANPAEWIDADRVLVRALQAFSMVTSLIASPHIAALQHLLGILRALWWATSWVRWLFSGDDRRKSTLARRSSAQADYESLRIDAMGSVMSGISEARMFAESPPSDAEVEREWRTCSADLLALLDHFLAQDSSFDEREAAGHGLVQEKLAPNLVRRVEELVLDRGLVRRNLRTYQDFGARFAVAGGRVLLGDDMGLGKTIQALAAIAHATSAEDERHHVVVCPASLIDNWIREINETLTTVQGWAYRGRARPVAYADWCEHGGILVTSYRQTDHLLAEDLPPIGFVVLDEAHEVKNPDTGQASRASQLTATSSRALLMGGTLMENRAGDLISLTAVADRQRWEDLVLRFGNGSGAHHDPDQFRRALSEFYLRRNQREVLLELPEVIGTDELIEVGEEERLVCKQALVGRNLARAREALTIGGGQNSEKMLRLEEIIKECSGEGRKVLVFSEFRDVLASVVEKVVEKIGSECAVIHGDVPKPQLPGIIQSFHDAPGFAALAMQIRVGGVGLNLQGASVVVLMEPQFKPSTEWQAVARAHRMGQTNCVMVYRLVAENSVDERIVELTDFKAELFDKLARRSMLAESSPEARDHRRVDESSLLTYEQARFGLPTS